MLGAIVGDIVGSTHEGLDTKTTEFSLFPAGSRFTDDTVLTCAVADSILTGRRYVEAFHEWFHRYPDAGYGGTFYRWAARRLREPYNSWGNGSAMRVSPIAYAFDSVDEVLAHAKGSAEVTHDHPEGIKGAQAIALAVFLARAGADRVQIRREVTTRFSYDLNRTLDTIRPTYGFDVSCQGSVPEAIIAFLESDTYEEAIRNAISLGGDADTMACMAGAIAEPFYGGVAAEMARRAWQILDDRHRSVVELFAAKFGLTLPV